MLRTEIQSSNVLTNSILKGLQDYKPEYNVFHIQSISSVQNWLTRHSYSHDYNQNDNHTEKLS